MASRKQGTLISDFQVLNSFERRATDVSSAISSKASLTGRVPELDGMRALASLPVIFIHCYPHDTRWLRIFGDAGWMGVDLFFVLSGYLITGILWDTVDRKYYYRNFIARRTL